MTAVETKRCRACGEERSLDQYRIHSGTGRPLATCKICAYAKHKARRATPEGREWRRLEGIRYRQTETGKAVHKTSRERYQAKRHADGPSVLREEKHCPQCLRTVPISTFYSNPGTADGHDSYCRDCRKSVGREWWRTRSPEYARELRRTQMLRHKYKLTPEAFADMLAAQGGRCAICRTDEPGGKWPVFHADHCHSTGEIRGLLCNNCNAGIGRFHDRPAVLRTAANYVEAGRSAGAAGRFQGEPRRKRSPLCV